MDDEKYCAIITPEAGYSPASPTQCSRQVIASAKRKDGDCRGWLEVELVEYRKHPTHCAIPAAGKHPQVGHFAKHLKPGKK